MYWHWPWQLLLSWYQLHCAINCTYCSEDSFNTLRPRQNGRRFADDIFKRISLNENVWISIKISLNFVPRGPINNIPALVQIMAWSRPGDKPLSEPTMEIWLTHICVTRPQWVNDFFHNSFQKRVRLHVFHMNIRSIPWNLNKLIEILSNRGRRFHIIGITETWLNGIQSFANQGAKCWNFYPQISKKSKV